MSNVSAILKTQLNERKFDNVDHRHNAPGYYLKQRINGHYTNYSKRNSLFSPEVKKLKNTVVDIVISGNTNNVYPENKFGIMVVERIATSIDNFRINIPRNGISFIDDEKVNYIAFPVLNLQTPEEHNYIVYVLDKNDIIDIYNDLTENTQSAGKAKYKDMYKNFLAPQPSGDGLCLTMNCIKELAIDSYILSEYY